ncbi:MAG: aminotransferase class I/II-fold pyridoxal phosphate-dependent enzyme, partial [Gammaproteobacteria bacterium]|nr:aminotransferase class I/II-fold pyridoxal phosphate-dependent enzyme [Gammaproteobacteria bacterium]
YAWESLTAAGAEVTEPKGGFYLFPNFEPLRERLAARNVNDSITFCERLLEDTGVACLPGHVFGRPESEMSVRIACVDFDGAAALAAAEGGEAIDETFLCNYCGRVMEAVEQLATWVSR